MLNDLMAIAGLIVGGVILAIYLHDKSTQTKYLAALAREVLRSADDLMQLRDEFHQLLFEFDLVCSDGQDAKPEVVHKVSTIQVPGNTVEMQDGLPLNRHRLIVGSSGSGKTVLLMIHLMRMIKAGLDIFVIDTKGEIGPIFGKYLTVTDTDGAEDMFRRMIKIAKERQAIFADATQEFGEPCRDLAEYNQVTGNKLQPIVLVVEELMVLLKIVDEEELIKVLGICRSAGVSVCALAQYLNAKVISREGSVNFTHRTLLGAADDTTINILFQNPGKADKAIIEQFVGPAGKAAQQEDGKVTTRTIPLVTRDMLKPWIKGVA